MSLILEALRKSEAERRRGHMPDLHAALPPAAPVRASRTAPWPWFAGGLLLLAGGLVAWSMLGARGANVPPSEGASASATPTMAHDALPPVPHLERAAAPVVARPTTPREPADTSAPIAPPIPNAPRTITGRMPPPSPAPSIDAASAPLPPPASDPAPLPLPPVADAGGSVMTLADLAPAQRKALPPLRLSMHMWNDDPAQRFVILDGNRVGEGDRVGDAVVRAITRDGVLLDWQGRALKVPVR